jgi:tetratricopeptide (TPR) repeat protein
MIRLFFFLLLTQLANQASATNVDDLQKGWALANYEVTGEAQDAAFANLIEQADDAVANHPGDAELLIWQGIIKSTYAGKAGGLSALSLVKAAKRSLEGAMEIDAMALDGSAYTSLGALYYQVPGWPIAFGSDKKARELLEKAIAINPAGIDANYFYADFLLQEKQYVKAEVFLQKALSAQPRDNRPLADMGRRKEINLLLAEIKSK